MNKGIKFVFFFILIFNFGFCSLFHKEPKYCAYLDKITNKFTKEVKQHYGFIYTGGGGSLMDNVQEVDLCYSTCNYTLSIEEARQLLVNSCERLLIMINKDKKIRPFLSHYPFTVNGISLSIGANPHFKTCNAEKKYVAHAFIASGKIHYSYYDCEKGRLERLYQEPYSEAILIVQKMNKVLETSN